MSTHNIGFYEDLTKIIIELSSNTHLISSAGYNEAEVYPEYTCRSLESYTKKKDHLCELVLMPIIFMTGNCSSKMILPL